VDTGGTWTAADQEGNPLATGRLELAIFINPAGLTAIGRNLFAKSEASGEPITGNPGENGIGTISQNFLEMSNVNVIDEMVRMIVGQRAYEINSKAIQTADSMLGIIAALKRS
jgi:flagellar basal-body rod protein FlgG